MQDRFEDTFPGFVVTHDAWYADNAMNRDYTGEVMVGFYAEDGGTAGEFAVRWYELGGGIVCRLELYDDSWASFCRMPQLMQWMQSWDQDAGSPSPQPSDLIFWLKMNGFVDLTTYVHPYFGDKHQAAA